MKETFSRPIISTILVDVIIMYFYPVAAYTQLSDTTTQTKLSNVTDISDAHLKGIVLGLSD